MSYCTCSQIALPTEVFKHDVLDSMRLICADCESLGPNLWMCLNEDCLRIGCSENDNDHNAHHNRMHPSHSLHINLSTRRIWCYNCEAELLLNMYKNGEQEANSYSTTFHAKRDSSDGSDLETPHYDRYLKPVGLVGLQNIGNTCYLNAALQALSNTLPLRSFFLECSSLINVLSEGRKPGLCRTYHTLMRDIWTKKNGGYVTPSGILYGIRNVHAIFRGYQQHDTQEFLRNFMDQLHEELKQACLPEPEEPALPLPAPHFDSNSSDEEYETCDSGVSERSSLSEETVDASDHQRVRSCSASIPEPPLSVKKQMRYRSIISDIFDGKLLSSVQCLTCDRISSRVETFQDLSLPIPSRDHLVILHGCKPGLNGTVYSNIILPMQEGWLVWIFSWLRSWFYGPTVALHDCLAAFFSTDELKGDNMYSCERCCKLRNGIKFSKVMQLPEVLCIHLKRFRHELMFSSKISSFVSFPLKGLDMRPYVHEDCTSHVTTYDLFSVICHHGTAGGGHYTCYALNQEQWYEFDDQYVTRVSADTVQSCEAYVLFYRKSVDSSHAAKVKSVRPVMTETQDKTAYVSRQWLSRFYTCAEPGPIDNSDYLCHHGSIHPDRAALLDQLAVAVPLATYDQLLEAFGGCPPLGGTAAQECSACHGNRKRISYELESFLRINHAAQNDDGGDGYGVLTHLLATKWLAEWQNYIQRKTYDPPPTIDNRITPESNPEEFVEITEDMWRFFHGIYGGGPEVRSKLGLLRKLSSENEAIVAEPIEKNDFPQPVGENEIAKEEEEQMAEDLSDSVSDLSTHTTSTDLSVESANVEVPPEQRCPPRKTKHTKGKRRFRYKIAQKYKPVKVHSSGDSC